MPELRILFADQESTFRSIWILSLSCSNRRDPSSNAHTIVSSTSYSYSRFSLGMDASGIQLPANRNQRRGIQENVEAAIDLDGNTTHALNSYRFGHVYHESIT